MPERAPGDAVDTLRDELRAVVAAYPDGDDYWRSRLVTYLYRVRAAVDDDRRLLTRADVQHHLATLEQAPAHHRRVICEAILEIAERQLRAAGPLGRLYCDLVATLGAADTAAFSAPCKGLRSSWRDRAGSEDG